MNVIEIKNNEIDEKIKSVKGKILVDFYATWCGPCKMLAPVISELSSEMEECAFYKIDVDNAEEAAKKYGIMSIPTLLLFVDGELKAKTIGFKTKEELKEFIENN